MNYSGFGFDRISKRQASHNCYCDLRNYWKKGEGKQSGVEKFMRALIVLLVGSLISQILIFIARDKSAVNGKRNEVTQDLTTLSTDSLIDYALDTNGGEIVEEFSQAEYFGWFSYFSHNQRKSLISSNNEPNNCWAFHGNRGHIAIKLAQRILPRNFTIFHINSVDVSKAPRKIHVFSLTHPSESVLLASFEFALRSSKGLRKHSEVFDCLYFCEEFVDVVLLEVEDNHGGPGTCVYQFQVHGINV